MALKAVIDRRSVALSAFMLMALVLQVLVTMSDVAAAERPLTEKEPKLIVDQKMGRQGFLGRVISFFWQSGKSSYEPVWPVSVQIFSVSYVQSS